MALFDHKDQPAARYSPVVEEGDLVSGSDAGTRALSVAAVENDFVEGVYDKLAKVYDLIFGPTLHPGRLQAIQRMNIQPGERVLEVGVGTGINLSLYPTLCQVTGIDFSSSMLEKARERVARKDIRRVRLLQMDAADLKFADGSFDIVYAPYLISVVPDPVKVAQEMHRVCRPGGRIIFLNHFLSANPILSRLERAMSPLTIHIGFKSDLDLPAFLTQADLQPISIEKVNIPKIWSLVTSVKE
jgi:phosphatidylethanolamine/phosphatidyl-N-methylethanolamine N-methyltransferase